jgi:chromosome segregation ATPase
LTNSDNNLDRATSLENQGRPHLDTSEQQLNCDRTTPQSIELNLAGTDRSLSVIQNTIVSDLDRDLQILNINFERDDIAGMSSNANSGSIDVGTELDLLLTSLELATPHPPQSSVTGDDSSISSILAQISTSEPVTHIQESIQALNASREQLTIAQNQLQILGQRNQAQVERVDANVLEVKQIKFRIQQLAQHSKQQIEHVDRSLDSLTKIRTEIITNLDKFGGYDEIRQMLAQLETARYALVIAHDRVTAGQETFYDSLQLIQSQVAERSNESELKLRQYQESIQSLSQTISTDRLRIAGMSVDMSTKMNELHSLNTQITTMHGQIVEKSQTLHSKITQIDRSFGELSQSVQQEKEQFYELTAESIEKADLIRSQLDEIIKQISDDRALFSTLETEIVSTRVEAKAQAERQLNNLELRDFELSSLSNNFKIDRKQQLLTFKKLSNWLWMLSGGMGIIFILLIRISLKS